MSRKFKQESENNNTKESYAISITTMFDTIG